jgi:hypothetical protein
VHRSDLKAVFFDIGETLAVFTSENAIPLRRCLGCSMAGAAAVATERISHQRAPDGTCIE